MADVSELPTILSPIPATTVTVTSTTLFHVAADNFGDAMLWNRVLVNNPKQINADGFWEYDVPGIETLTLPPQSTTSNGGILDAFPAPAAKPRRFSNDFDFRFA